MNEELIKQRVKYLVEHGGIYPTQRWECLPLAIAIAVVVLVDIAIKIL